LPAQDKEQLALPDLARDQDRMPGVEKAVWRDEAARWSCSS
jgi:hypothetical protein